jgi:hypothetical protein
VLNLVWKGGEERQQEGKKERKEDKEGLERKEEKEGRSKGIYIRPLCQKNEGSVGTKQRPTKMGGRITYWTLPP